MISSENMFRQLLVADPSFQGRWDAFLADWEQERDLPLYIALGELAEHLIEQCSRGETDHFNAVFDVIEQWHTQGDSYVREAATIGLLEGIQNLLSGNDRTRRGSHDLRAGDFERWLRPETRRWWDLLYRFWDGDVSALKQNGD